MYTYSRVFNLSILIQFGDDDDGGKIQKNSYNQALSGLIRHDTVDLFYPRAHTGGEQK